MTEYTDCTHNLRHDLGQRGWSHDLPVSADADIVGYQEAHQGQPSGNAVLQFCTNTGRAAYAPKGTANPISWNPKVFDPVLGERGVKVAHTGAASMGLHMGASPSRDFVWVGLLHKTSGKRLLKINVHPTQGATKPEPNEWTKEQNAWKNWSIGQYWLEVLSFSAAQMARDAGDRSDKPFWDIVTIGGDFNADMLTEKADQWYFPSRMLTALYDNDSRVPGGLDHILVSHGSDVDLKRRWSVAARTDHRIHFRTSTIHTHQDFPA